MNKEELIQIIKNLPCDDFIIYHKFLEPANKFDLPNLRTGPNYPPYYNEITTIIEPEKFEITISGKFDA